LRFLGGHADRKAEDIGAMPDNLFALSTLPPAAPAESDYDALLRTVTGTARGRWFLAEYARRNRNADTRLVLGAIERMERVFRGEQGRQLRQDTRTEQLDMAKAITQAPTNAESAGASADEEPPNTTDVFTAAQRLQEVAWTMRERGMDVSICDQVAELSGTVLQAPALRGATRERTEKLGDVLRHLERRIETMLAEDVDAELFARSSGQTAAADKKSETIAHAPTAPVLSEAPISDAGLPNADEASSASFGEVVAETELTWTDETAGVAQSSERDSAASSALPTPRPPSTPEQPPLARTRKDPLAAIKSLSDEERLALFT
jgi:chemotaxis protein CheZ